MNNETYEALKELVGSAMAREPNVGSRTQLNINRLNNWIDEVAKDYEGNVEPSNEEIKQYMESHNADEVGQGDNAWTFKEAKYHLLLDDRYFYLNK